MAYDLVVVGGGNMGAALLMGMLSSGEFDPADVAIVEPLADRRAILTALFPGVLVSDEIPACDGAVLAVKPPDIPDVAAEAAAAGARRVLSIAAGVTTADHQPAAGAGRRPWCGRCPTRRRSSARACRRSPPDPAPTTTTSSGRSGSSASVGMTCGLAESQFDAVTGLTGSGPAYVFFVAEALIEAGVGGGPRPGTVEPMVAQLLVGSAALLAAQGDPAVTPRDGDLARWHNGRRDRRARGSGRPFGLRRGRARCGGTQPGAGTHRFVTVSRPARISTRERRGTFPAKFSM